jgi:hypothetical protein
MHIHPIYIGQVAFARTLTLRTVSMGNDVPDNPRQTFRRRLRRSLPQWLLRR